MLKTYELPEDSQHLRSKSVGALLNKQKRYAAN